MQVQNILTCVLYKRQRTAGGQPGQTYRRKERVAFCLYKTRAVEASKGHRRGGQWAWSKMSNLIANTEKQNNPRTIYLEK